MVDLTEYTQPTRQYYAPTRKSFSARIIELFEEYARAKLSLCGEVTTKGMIDVFGIHRSKVALLFRTIEQKNDEITRFHGGLRSSGYAYQHPVLSNNDLVAATESLFVNDIKQPATKNLKAAKDVIVFATIEALLLCNGSTTGREIADYLGFRSTVGDTYMANYRKQNDEPDNSYNVSYVLSQRAHVKTYTFQARYLNSNDLGFRFISAIESIFKE